jgi:hypothetical protein
MITTALDYTPRPAPTRKAQKYTAEQRQMWRTPNTPSQPVLQLVARALGGEIGLDPTADDARSVPAHWHITASENCLMPDVFWPGVGVTAFMNPPFDAPHLYLEELARHYRPGLVCEAIALLKIGTLSNQKTGALIRENASAICCWGAGKVGRMAFIDHEGYAITGADFDTVLVYFGPNRARFSEVFSDWGMVAAVLQ